MPTGRPRAFDTDQALDQALKVFWRKGYEGASLPDLTEAMGINRPSLYAAFGNKEQLFRKALDRYAECHGCHVREALRAPTAREVVERFLLAGIDLITDPRNPRGCLIVQGALACGDSAEALRHELIKRRSDIQGALHARFKQAIDAGDLPRDCRPADLARYFVTVMHGMAVQAATGASRGQLRTVAKFSLQALPAAKPAAQRPKRQVADRAAS